ncbi:MAG: cellulase family glycosylhydrolase, partial [Oscillospiraceae bacterium]|nr:cellulase family glycosylhydrolase [Oscillospiraceae bacterium]
MKKLKGFYAGVNLGGWYSQCDYSPERLDGFITEEDFRRISGWGFDHVRIPVDYNLFQDGEGGFIEDGFGRVEKAIGYCRKYGLRMILDLHKTQGFSFDKGEAEFGFFENGRYQELFLSLWREFARRFSHNADMLAFELLNEVTEPCFMPKWNELA